MKKILFLFLFSCISSKTPNWYVESQQNTETILYGVGSSTNREQAIEDALSNLKEKVYTSVSSQKFIQDIVTNQQTANEYVNTVKLKTPNIPIANYQVTKIEEKNGIFYAMVQVEKQKLGEVINETLNESTEDVQSDFSEFHNTADLIKKVFILEKLYEKCVKHFELERFYTSLGYLYPDNTCTEAVKTKHNLAVEYPVQIVNSNVKLLPVVVNIFAKKFNIIQTSERAISYKTEVKTEHLQGGSYITGITMDIMQYGIQKKYSIKCVGNSTVSTEASIDAAIANCLEKSQTQSFNQFFTE